MAEHKLIGFFGTQADSPYLKKLQAMTLGVPMKGTMQTMDLFTQIALRVKSLHLTHLIVTCPKALALCLNQLPDFIHGLDKRGQKKNLSLNDYHGSYFTIPGYRLGREESVDVLILNPLEHLYTVPEADFVFKRFVSKITQPEKWFPDVEFTWEVLTPANAEAVYQRFSTALCLAVDIETTRDSPHRTIECVCYTGLFADGTIHTVVIETLGLASRDLEFANIMWMRKFNALPIPKVLQNGLYDHTYFARYASPCSHWFFDTQHLFHSWYAELPKRLDFITVFTVRKARYWKDDNSTGKRFDFLKYNAQDGYSTMLSLLGIMMEYPEWATTNYVKHEFPLVFPCLHVSLDGLRINEDKFVESFSAVSKQLETTRQRLNSWIPGYNPASSQQTVKLLKNLGQSKADSSNEKFIQVAQAESPFNERVLDAVLDYRGLSKLLSTYINRSKFWHGRLLYTPNPAGTETMRLACNESAFWCGFQIQNVPRGTEVKSFIQADEGYYLGEADYSQSEAYCVGYRSGCTNLIDLLNSPRDYHAWNASCFFGIAYETIYDESVGKTINKAIRDLSKRTNHGANYNMGPDVMVLTIGPKMVRAAKSMLKLPEQWSLRSVTEYLLQRYAITYPEVKKDYVEWVKRTIPITRKLVSELGWTRYCFGDPNKSKPMLNSYIAHGPQNLSVTIINEVFYNIWRRTVYGDLRVVVRLKAQIHDSILFCYHKDRPELAEEVRKSMENPKEITDIKGVKRTMLIPPDLSCGKEFWSELK